MTRIAFILSLFFASFMSTSTNGPTLTSTSTSSAAPQNQDPL